MRGKDNNNVLHSLLSLPHYFSLSISPSTPLPPLSPSPYCEHCHTDQGTVKPETPNIHTFIIWNLSTVQQLKSLFKHVWF